MPRGIPNQFDFGLFDSFKVKQSLLYTPTDGLVHGAAWRREGHSHVDAGAGDYDAVDQAQVDDVAADFRVDNLSQAFEDDLFRNFHKHAAGFEPTMGETGFNFGLRKWFSIKPTFNSNVRRLRASNAQPSRMAAVDVATMATEVTESPKR